MYSKNIKIQCWFSKVSGGCKVHKTVLTKPVSRLKRGLILEESRLDLRYLEKFKKIFFN